MMASIGIFRFTCCSPSMAVAWYTMRHGVTPISPLERRADARECAKTASLVMPNCDSSSCRWEREREMVVMK